MKVINTALHMLSFIILFQSIFVIHEYGHLKEYQKLGILVEEVSLGIGPPVYQYQTTSFVVSFRLIPIMAYVAPTEKAGDLFKKQGSPRDKIAVQTAGVRNNLLLGLIIVLFLQTLGWTKNNLSTRELAQTMAVTPFKILFRFFSFLIGCITLGYINLAGKFLLSTGGINPPKLLKQFIVWNFVIGIFNLVPILPLDGGHVAQTVFSTIEMAYFESGVLFVALCTITGIQDMRILEIESITKSRF